MRIKSRARTLASLAPLLLASPIAAIATPALEPLVVTGTRRPERIDAVPASITIISAEELQSEASLSNNSLGDALGKMVPGLGIGAQSQSVFGQTVRGRRVLVLIDGIPQHTIRNVARDLQTISPQLVDRVEVIRGTTPLYGEGAAGGIINVITRRPTGEQLQLRTDLSVAAAPRNTTDSLGGSFAQSVAGKRGRLDYTVLGALDRNAGLFDAAGERIPPDPHGQGGLADLWGWNGLARVGLAFTANERLEVSATYFQNLQNTEHTTDPAVNTAPAGSEKARVRQGLELEDPVGSRNALFSLGYQHRRLLGGQLSAQLYFRDYHTRFFPFDGRLTGGRGGYVMQSRLESRRLGSRLQLDLPLPARLSALLGIDGSGERTAQPVAILDPEAYDASGGLVFREVERRRTWVPEMTVGNLAPFLQLQWDATRWLALRAGARQELIYLDVEDFVTLSGNDVQGGALTFKKRLLHAGVVVGSPLGLSIFTTASQGYSLPDVGLILRNAPTGSTLESLNTAPQKVNAYELGLRREGRSASGTIAIFYSHSILGTSSGGFNMPVVRAPERVYGVEGTAEARVLRSWRAGIGVSWLEGELDKQNNGNYTHLNSYRIPPLKVTAQVGRRIIGSWDAQVFAVYSGARDRFSPDPMTMAYAFGERPVKPIFLLELMAAGRAGPGRLRLGVSNLLNTQYAPVTSQLLWSGNNSTHAAGTGLTATLGYSLSY
jgi:iron complex outermembrane recepter protein